MNKEKLYINITFFGLGLFLFTFVFHFDLPLKTMICLGIGYLFIMGGLNGMLSIYSKNNDSQTND